ncbi:LLM class flavin-dependent oxidoreductase [Chelatococcus reniformis]|uniref:N5,N10-methylene tetrahydromethanopterin reductase n=1 Tax=Chelatococcus reniformis TaxID=1494448 RepID=A0A916XIR6_9HYPH|nr:LLM class flavin-dependent oxidoreductase [Chelatococcus reniformis]GGC75003.1 N5,N10-methylene tetrahydromethanopterin reductase [Chelatococcus reniformis]
MGPDGVDKKILLNAFNMNSVGHICHGLWTHPRDQSADYARLDYWVKLAQTLERGKFDGLFLADVIGANDVYGASPDAALLQSVQVPINDPIVLISAMAYATRHLGFGVTANLTYERPYLLARRFSTLDHLTGGRIGWNIVTGYLDSAARAMGLTEQIRHDDRYDMADDYLDLVYKLWEGSWEDDAVVRDARNGRFTDPAKVHRIRHDGPFYQLDAIHLCEPSPQRTPVLYQAGGSPRGRAFAARHAECVFTNSLTVDLTRSIVADLRRRAVANGRAAEDIKIFSGVIVIVDRTEKAAQEKLREYQRYASPAAGLTHFCASIGVDLSRYGPDEPIEMEGTQAMVAALESITRYNPGRPWTVRRLLELMKLGARNTPIVGSPSQVADQLTAFVRETDVDGFNLMRAVTPESYEDFVDLVVPELQQRGAYKEDYAEGTLRDRLFAGRGGQLPSRHYGRRFRYGAGEWADEAVSRQAGRRGT